MARRVVARAADVPPGERLIVEVDGRSIGIFNVGGEYLAIRNMCPHAGAELCTGLLTGIVTATVPGTERVERPGEFVRCPWHQWEFDLRTGQSWFDPAKTRVRRYDVEVESCGVDDGTPEQAALTAEREGRQPGPHVVERYAVVQEGDVLVIDTAAKRRGGRKDGE